jgi:hypothetical protein
MKGACVYMVRKRHSERWSRLCRACWMAGAKGKGREGKSSGKAEGMVASSWACQADEQANGACQSHNPVSSPVVRRSPSPGVRRTRNSTAQVQSACEHRTPKQDSSHSKHARTRTHPKQGSSGHVQYAFSRTDRPKAGHKSTKADAVAMQVRTQVSGAEVHGLSHAPRGHDADQLVEVRVVRPYCQVQAGSQRLQVVKGAAGK